jgi:hypothetical protein
MAPIRTISHPSSGDFLSAHAIVHTPIALEMEQEGEASPSRIRLSYRDVRKFQHDGSNAGKIPKMLWKMLQELGYEKQPKYYGTQVMFEGSKPMWHVQIYIFTPSPSREFLRWTRYMQPLPQDVPSTLESVMLPTKLTRSLVHAIVNSSMEQSTPVFPNNVVGLPTSMWSLYPIQGTSSSRSKWILPLCSPRN